MPFAPRGRFAPTPSGPLHLGSLLTALASWLDARAVRGAWLLRLDDLDAPRCRPEHADTICRQLEAHGLLWDETPRRQSAHLDRYDDMLDTLRRDGRLYACDCTRATLARDSLAGPDGPVYAGTCRSRGLPLVAGHAWRLRIDRQDALILDDRWLGRIERDPQQDIGDFIVRRADGQPGYQLACVVDDLDQRIDRVVRGADLLGSSLRQRLLFDVLGHPAPGYAHGPLLVDAGSGLKLSKQNHAPAIDTDRPVDNLRRCLRLLGQDDPAGAGSPAELLRAALENWDETHVPRSGTPAFTAS